MSLEVKLLGPLQILRDGAPISGLRSRKALALFVFLALTDQAVPRAKLVDLIWPEQDEKRGRANLSWALNHLKTHLPGCISAERQALRFTPSDTLSIDVHQLQLAIASGNESDIAATTALIHGDLLDGFMLGNNPEFELWLIGERERLRQLAVLAVTALIDGKRQQGALAEALPYAEKWVALMPWRETAHHQLMLCYLAAKQPAAALTQFERCQRIMQDELGIELSAEINTLYQSIQQQPAQRVAAPSHNLTRPNLPLIGRAAELATLADLVTQKHTRLVTLVGIGGAGKTRLATEFGWLQTAHDSSFPDGVYFVPAAHITYQDGLADAITQAVGAPVAARESTAQQLHNFLRRKRMLLIIDNFEQLLVAAPLVVALLEQAPQLTLLVTSQQRLGISAETSLPLQGLAPSPDAACKLFIHCAKQQDAHFTTNDEHDAAIKAICIAVGGNPLAIQLAATWVPLFSPSAILAELERDLAFITADIADLPDRQRSIQAVFDHVWRQLNDDEQALLAALSIFESDFGFAAAVAVASARPVILLRLVNRSLLEQGQQGRYRIHPLIRRFALVQLEHSERAMQVAEQLASFVADRLANSEVAFYSAETNTIKQFELDWDIIVAGWQLLKSQERWTDIEQILRPLDQFLTITTRTRQGAALFAEAAQATPSGPLKGRLLAHAGIYLSRLARYDEALQLLADSLVLLDVSLPSDRALALMGRSSIDRDQGRLDDALSGNREALDLLAVTDDRFRRATCLNQLGMVMARMRDLDSAETYYHQSLDLYRELGSQWATTQPINNLAIVSYLRKQFNQAQALMAQNAALYATLGDIKGQAVTLSNQATIAYETGDPATAIALFERCLPLCQQVGDRWLISNTLSSFGYASAQLGKLTDALRYFQEALREAQAIEAIPLEQFAIIGLAQVLRLLGEEEMIGISAELITHMLHHPALNHVNKAKATLEQTALVKSGIPASQFESTATLSPLETLLLHLLAH